MTQGILGRDQNFIPVVGAVNSATDTSSSVRSLQYDPTTRGLTVHIIGGSITGASTSAKQDTGNTSIASIDTKTPALGQALAASSTPVVLTAAQITTLTPPAAITGFATSAKQDTLLTELQLKADLTETQPVSVASLPLPSGAATSAKQLADNHQVTVSNIASTPVISGFATSANQQPPSTTPTIYNVTLTSANTEYSQALPANTREFRFICRTLYDVRFAWVTGKVATPTAPYLTLTAGVDYHSDNDNLASQTLYLASSTVGVVVEIECWQ